MRVVVIGGNGTLGKAVCKELSARHEVISVSRNSEKWSVDLTSPSSIKELYLKIGKFNAICIAAGRVHFEEFSHMDASKYEIGLKDKLMGQINAVLLANNHMEDRGSFTLISGILGHDPIKAGTSAAMVNGAIESFVKACSIELPRQIRINCVSPTILEESVAAYGSSFQGYLPVKGSVAALAYSKSVEGAQTGQIYRVGY